MKKRREKETSEQLIDLARSSSEEVALASVSFERSNNPYYAWYAIDVCIKNKKPLPNWLMSYLAQCSERILSGTTRQTPDLRKCLPWVLGFSPKKSGPGNVLDPDRTKQKTLFAYSFGVEIMKGNDPVTARRNACDALDGKAANVDDKTLTRWLLGAYNLKKAPANAEQWKKIIQQDGSFVLFMMDQFFRRIYFEFRPDRVSRDSDVT
jgi:hypothetical protein